MYLAAFGQMKKQLGQLSKWLDKASAYAETRKFDAANFLGLRLAPDQLPLSRQIGIACDTVKLGAARITGKDAPSHADDQTTFGHFKERIASVISYLDGFTAKDFETAATRSVTTPRWEGKTMTGHDYFLEHVMPNFYFHLAHVYALLRHGGVELGKADYLGALTQKAP